MTINKTPIPKRLKEARTALNLSQKKLGVAAGIDEFSSSARMNQYETGKHIPDYLTLKNISKVLDYPVAYFYADDDLLAQSILLFYRLNKSSKKLLLKYMTTDM